MGGMQSALSMFDEYSMTSPMQLAPYTGFTEDEVEGLCKRVGRDIRQIRDWYDGYRVSTAPEAKKIHLYCPVSVVKAMRTGYVNNYWNETETYEALQRYIDWDADGLKEDVAVLMEGGKLPVDITGWQNELTTFHSKDDILTLLIHLGYLGYDSDTKEVFIPNRKSLMRSNLPQRAGTGPSSSGRFIIPGSCLKRHGTVMGKPWQSFWKRPTIRPAIKPTPVKRGFPARCSWLITRLGMTIRSFRNLLPGKGLRILHSSR